MRKGRHRVRAAFVETGIDEEHCDDAQERIAVAGDGSAPVECVGLRGGHGARVGGGAVDRILRGAGTRKRSQLFCPVSRGRLLLLGDAAAAYASIPASRLK